MLRPYVTGEQRRWLKDQVDRRIRELREPPNQCAGCGGPYGNFTPGCKTCSNRYHGKTKRRRLAA